MKEAFAIAAAILALLSYIPYLRGVVKGQVQPHAYTWGIWSLVSGITLAAQIVKGAGIGAVPTATAACLTVAIFALSLTRGFRNVTRLDTTFLVLALAAVVPWILIKDPTISVVTAVAIDALGFAPTLRKTWVKPTSESVAMYALNVLRHLLSLLALEAYNLATVLHSGVMLIMNSAMVTVILVGVRVHRASSARERQQDSGTIG